MTEKTSATHFSDLQLLENDDTAHGLELFRYDILGNAPEPDAERWAPEPDHERWAPQVVSDDPRTNATIVQASEEIYSNSQDSKHYGCRISKRLCWSLAVCISIAVVAIAVGVGVGVGVAKRSTNDHPTPTSSTPGRTSKLKHDLIEHSSFAVAVSSEGNKHLFFQEQSGIIRQVYRNNLQNSWHASTDFVVALNAKNSTPMSALSLSNITLSGTDNRIGDFVFLAYINRINEVNVVVSRSTSNSWVNQTVTTHGRSLQVSPDSEYLSIGRAAIQDENSFIPTVCLVLENPMGNISAHRGSTFIDEAWEMEDISAELFASLPTGKFASPFTTVDVTIGTTAPILTSPMTQLNATTAAVFMDKNGSALISSILNANKTFYSTTFPQSPSMKPMEDASHTNTNAYPGFDFSIDLFEQVDLEFPIGLVVPAGGFWVNGTALDTFSKFDSKSFYGLPSSVFLYPRLATCAPANDTGFYIYHQLSATVIAEEKCDHSIGNWEASNITIMTD